MDKLLSGILIFVFCAVCSYCDIRKKQLPYSLLVCGLVIAFACRFIFSRPLIFSWGINAVCSGLFYFIIRMITRGRLGIADVLFGVFQGLVLPGAAALLVCVLIECICAGVWVVVMRNKSQTTQSPDFPFIPFMSLGLIISILIF